MLRVHDVGAVVPLQQWQNRQPCRTERAVPSDVVPGRQRRFRARGVNGTLDTSRAGDAAEGA